MERTYRNLQKISGSYFVSLPKKWVENFNLSKKSSILITVRSDGILLISPKHRQEVVKSTNEIILNSNPYIAREIVKECLSGQTNIVILSDKPFEESIRDEIRWFVNGLPNTEITEEQPQRIVVQNFGYKQIPTRKLIQRLLYLILNMFDDLETNKYEDLNYNFNQLRKFYFILVIHIRTYLRTGVYVTEDKDFTPLEAMDYRMFCEKIEDIGSILRDLHISEEIKEYFTEIKQYFNEVMIAYQKKALELAHKVWKKRDILIEKGNLLINDLRFKEKGKIRDLMRIVYNCKDMAALI